MLAYPADSDSENEEGVLEKIASTFGHMFSEDNSEEDEAEEHVAEVKSDSGDTETADHSVAEDFPLFGPSGKGGK
ncbi:hypothetical protein LAZ67_2003684 [Cordylochernes scorpioides]|uniref:Uncharacterized protein n=1 Tax=Cordylochernes scorpioides TaxID=51811 RepID=A0ABY6K344_9ARAC|nr:hypothetical protein LAZ67_2003684 [Cordylochernes scorpioides]